MKMTVRTDPGDGNDSIDAEIEFAFLPRIGEKISAEWACGTSILDVIDVVHFPQEDGRIEVWGSLEGYALGDLRGAMEGLRAREEATP